MKKIFVFVLGIFPVFALAQEAADTPEEKPVPVQVTAPQTVSFMGRTFYFSYWEVFAVNSYLPNPVLTLDPSWGYRPNKNGVPNIHAQYAIKRGITPNTLLGAEDELLSFTTETAEPPSNSRTEVMACADGVVSYTVAEGEDIVMAVVTKHAPEGNIIFSGVLKRNPKKLAEVNTKHVKTDFGTFTREHETVKFDTKSIAKEASRYAQAMCRMPFPEWLKQVPTVQKIQNQSDKQLQKQGIFTPVKKLATSKKSVSATSKTTTIPKLQTVQPAYRSGK